MDNQTWNPTVYDYLEAKRKAKEAEEAANSQAMIQEGAGLGVEIASALANPARKGTVLLNHYNDTSAPKVIEGYKPTASGDGLRKSADGTRKEGAAKGAKITSDYFEGEKVNDMTTQRDRAGKEFGWKEGDQERKAAQQAQEDDPGSPNSQLARDLAQKLLPKGNFEGMSATQLNNMLPGMQRMYAAEWDNKWKQSSLDETKAKRDLDASQFDKTLELNKAKLDTEKNANPAKREFEQLPIEKKEMITGLAKSNAGKESIANQIDAVMGNWDKLSENERLQQGRQLIKTLNSTQGSDAVGAEEAKRLAGKLDFALGNVFNNNPVQFGRDLEGFKADAVNTSKAIRDSIDANTKVIDQTYGRTAAPVQNAFPRQVTNAKTGHSATVSNEQELKEAQAEGFQ